jgi:hypothetical protein
VTGPATENSLTTELPIPFVRHVSRNRVPYVFEKFVLLVHDVLKLLQLVGYPHPIRTGLGVKRSHPGQE